MIPDFYLPWYHGIADLMKPTGPRFVLSDLYNSNCCDNFISYLPAFQISPEIGEGRREPVVYSM